MLLDIWNDVIVKNLMVIIWAIYLFTIVSTVVLVILEKRDPAKTSVWVLFLLLLPVIGLIFYIFFGQNHRKQKIFSRKGLSDLQQIEVMTQNQLLEINSNKYVDIPAVADNIKIITLLLNNSKALLTLRNSVKILQTGSSTFQSIIEAIDNATTSIHLEFYIVASDDIGIRIKDKLIAKAKTGVEVRLIYDDVGSWKLSKRFIAELKDSGAQVYPFMKVAFPFLTSKVNYRNHRKIIVIDGRIGFMGGMNIADRYHKGDSMLGTWYDTVLRIEGEAVRSLQVIFSIDWYFVSKIIIPGREKYFPEHIPNEKHALQVTASGPDSDWSSIMQAFFSAITRAKKNIYIATPYFVPNESILTALKTASLSGVNIKIMLPGKSDSTIVYWSSMSYVSELLEAGIEVFLFQGGFNHSKILMIDGRFASVGSANMDIRSFEDNFELLAMVYDEELTIQLESQFVKDLGRCKKVCIKEWSKRRGIQTFKESFARMFSPLF